MGGHQHLPVGEGVGVPAAAGSGQPRPIRLPVRARYGDEPDLGGPLAHEQCGDGHREAVPIGGGEYGGRLGVARRAETSQLGRAADVGQ
ncbi:hypothetical protein [Amycolatopsis balhimycina]|uniref:hypothetical protein n=1 Tax=Amycolatopsis balhimycina TaxID=208443 RepID=UPI000F78A006|nr:hypothetical protein [Amycolatopsis balhimycina]